MQKLWQKLKELFREWWQKALICLVAAAALSVGVEWLQIQTEPKLFVYEEKGITGEFSLPLDEANLIVCERVGSIVHVEGGPAELQFFPDGSKSFNRISVLFDQPATDSGVMRVLYAAGEEDCTLENSTQLPYNPGMEWLDFVFAEGAYNKVKVQVAGVIDIKEVKVSHLDYQYVSANEKWSGKRIVMMTVFLFAVFIFFFKIHGWTKFRGCVTQGIRELRENWKRNLIRLGIAAAVVILTYIGLRAYVPYVLDKPYNWVLRIFCMFVSFAVGSLFLFTKTLATKPEVFFLIICLLTGSLIAVFCPATSTVSWDDGYHYMSASSYSYLGQTRLTEQDSIALAPWSERVYDLNAVDEWHTRQDQLYQQGVTNLSDGNIAPKNYWMAFSGLGLYLGRVLGFPYHRIWEMGRLFSLIAYAIIGYFAIRRLKSGKMILAAVLLIPECVFLAATYSYDPGVIVFLALGLSYCFAEWQEPNKPLTPFNAVIILGALFLGSYTKGVYFPVLIIPMLLPAAKFKSKTWRGIFIGIAMLLMLYLIWDMVKPFMGGSSSEATDARIYSDADAGKQIPYILDHPLFYTGVLLRGLRSVFGPENSQGLFTFFAYMGKAPNNFLYVIILAIVAFTDKNADDHELCRRGWVRLLGEFLMFGIACLAGTSMYIVFSPYGAGQIEGFQYRYVLPVLYPAIMLLGSGNIRNQANRAVYNGLLYATIGFVNFSAVLLLILNLYS